MKIKALINIRHNGELYEAEKIFEADEVSGQKLIEEKAAELISRDSGEKLLKDMTVVELKGYAKSIGLELQGTKKDDILKEIEEYDKNSKEE